MQHIQPRPAIHGWRIATNVPELMCKSESHGIYSGTDMPGRPAVTSERVSLKAKCPCYQEGWYKLPWQHLSPPKILNYQNTQCPVLGARTGHHKLLDHCQNCPDSSCIKSNMSNMIRRLSPWPIWPIWSIWPIWPNMANNRSFSKILGRKFFFEKMFLSKF